MFRWYWLLKLKLSLYCSTGSLPWLVQYLLRELFISRHWYSAFTPCCWCCCVVEANPLSAETWFPPISILEGCLLEADLFCSSSILGRHYSCMILSFQCCTSVSFRPDIFYTHFSSRLDFKIPTRTPHPQQQTTHRLGLHIHNSHNGSTLPPHSHHSRNGGSHPTLAALLPHSHHSRNSSTISPLLHTTAEWSGTTSLIWK